MPNDFDIKPKPVEYIPMMKIKVSKELKPVAIVIKPGFELPITELLEVIEFVTALANAISAFLVPTPKNLFTGIIAFVPVVPKAIKAVIGIHKIPAEFSSLTPKQKEKLLITIKEQLLLTDVVEEIIVIALDVIMKIKGLINLIKGNK